MKASEAKCKKAYIQSALSSWRQKTNELNMDRDGKKMWNLIRAMNDERKQSAPIVLVILIDKDEQIYTGWRAANCFIDDYQETSTLKMPHSRRHEVNDEMKRLQREKNLALNLWNNLST